MFLSERRTQRIAAKVILSSVAILVFGAVVAGVATFSSTQGRLETKVIAQDVEDSKEVKEMPLLITKALPPFSFEEVPKEEVEKKIYLATATPEEKDEITTLQLTKEEEVTTVKKEAKQVKKETEIIKKNLASNNKEYVYYEFYEEDGTRVVLNAALQEYLYELCIKYDIEEHFKLLMCQFFTESRFQEKLVSGTNDYGIAQINKGNHKWLKKELNVTDFLNAKQSLLCGTYMMSDYLKNYEPGYALGKYNTGKACVNGYAKRILNLYNNKERVKQIKKEDV